MSFLFVCTFFYMHLWLHVFYLCLWHYVWYLCVCGRVFAPKCLWLCCMLINTILNFKGCKVFINTTTKRLNNWFEVYFERKNFRVRLYFCFVLSQLRWTIINRSEKVLYGFVDTIIILITLSFFVFFIYLYSLNFCLFFTRNYCILKFYLFCFYNFLNFIFFRKTLIFLNYFFSFFFLLLCLALI